jgi:hypothetical protein
MRRGLWQVYFDRLNFFPRGMLGTTAPDFLNNYWLLRVGIFLLHKWNN